MVSTVDELVVALAQPHPHPAAGAIDAAEPQDGSAEAGARRYLHGGLVVQPRGHRTIVVRHRSLFVDPFGIGDIPIDSRGAEVDEAARTLFQGSLGGAAHCFSGGKTSRRWDRIDHRGTAAARKRRAELFRFRSVEPYYLRTELAERLETRHTTRADLDDAALCERGLGQARTDIAATEDHERGQFAHVGRVDPPLRLGQAGNMRVLPFLLLSSWARAQNLVPVPTPNLGSRCDDLDPAPLVAAIEHEVELMQKMSGALTVGTRAIPYAEYARTTLAPLGALAQKGAATLCAELPRRFAFFRNPTGGAGTFTVYHNPMLRGSRTRREPYLYPLYRRPAGALSKLTTAEILGGALEGQGLELIYLGDPTEANAVHVEGSATVLLDDGSTISVGSDGHNGHPYQNIGKLLSADNKIPKSQATPIGMTRARKYFIDHPAELNVYWGKNPHYVFFKERTGPAATGKFGALTPGRSLAVDPAYLPMGAAVWIRTDMPRIAENRVAEWISYGRVAIGQDTGAGIKGPARVDVFFGTGDYATQAAQVTTRPGEIYVLVAK